MSKNFSDLDMQQFADSLGNGGLEELISKVMSGQHVDGFWRKSIDDWVESVRDFHKLVGAEISNRPRLLNNDQEKCQKACQLLEDSLAELREMASDEDTLLSRLCLSIEETVEWLQSHLNNDLVAAADAIGDRAYVLLGDAVAAGMPLAEIFEEIHQSNMSKAETKKGLLGKASKSAEYRKPDLELILSMASMNSDRIEEEQADDKS